MHAAASVEYGAYSVVCIMHGGVALLQGFY